MGNEETCWTKLGIDSDSPRRAYILAIFKGRHRGIVESQQAVARRRAVSYRCVEWPRSVLLPNMVNAPCLQAGSGHKNPEV